MDVEELAFKGILDATRPKDFADRMLDVASWYGVKFDNVLQDFRAALVGNHEAIYRFRVIIKSEDIAAELLRLDKHTLTGKDLELAKVDARYNIIMKETLPIKGDALRTGRKQSYENSREFEEFLNTYFPFLIKIIDRIDGVFTRLHLKLVLRRVRKKNAGLIKHLNKIKTP